jgi:flagellar protein FliJ
MTGPKRIYLPSLSRVSESATDAMFTFKFESSLNYRKTVEEKKLVEFSEGKKKMKKEKELLEEIQREQYIIMEQFKKMQEHNFHSPDVDLYLAYITLFKEKEALQKEIVIKVNQEVEILRKELLEAVKNRKIMDTLKERQLREFNENIAVYERKTADETAVLSYVRNKQ